MLLLHNLRKDYINIPVHDPALPDRKVKNYRFANRSPGTKAEETLGELHRRRLLPGMRNFNDINSCGTGDRSLRNNRMLYSRQSENSRRDPARFIISIFRFLPLANYRNRNGLYIFFLIDVLRVDWIVRLAWIVRHSYKARDTVR